WAPKLVPEIGYCEYNCTLCGNTCPTGAIRRVSLAQKHDTRLGLAVVDRNICISWSDGRQCMVCEKHCPVPDKAIKAREDYVNGKVIRKPLVDGNLCVGCGVCQNKCPVNPVRAIRVRPF
ncbi:MAG: 4Fe-4S binding protein, partial [Candidatus Omnitrophica bacterium]|nr:4Fe-4S binding protein [Candidatus Omnitrophota bacterium]